MPTVAPNLEEETQRAWTEYLEAVRGLEGDLYRDAEDEAWERLQQTLRALGAGEPAHGS